MCALKFSVLAIVVVCALVFVAMLSYGLGRRFENRKYWKMLHRAGSRVDLN